jgi:hypothetical protein
MSTIALDTHEIVKKLQTRGFKPEQAEGITDALKDSFQANELATKADLEHSIEKLRLEIKAEIAGIKAEFAPLKWGIGILVAATIPILIKTFF